MKLTTLFIFFFIAHSGFSQKSLDALLNQYNTRSVPYISVEELRMLQVNSDIVVLDSREDDEYNVSHLKGASLVGYDNFSVDTISEEITDKDTPIVVYCSVGIRSEMIGEKLKKAGYTNVKNLYGGIFEWKNKEYPVLNSNEKVTDSVHTFSKAWSKWLKEGIKVYSKEQ